MATFKEVRELWIDDGVIIGEFYIKSLDAIVTLLLREAKDGPTHTYELIRFFRVGDRWEASVDEVGGGTERGLVTCIRKLSSLMAEDVIAFKAKAEGPEAGSRFVGTEADIVKTPPGEEVNK
jgi:hypothetical protein